MYNLCVENKERTILLLLFIVYAITFSHFVYTGFATSDDYWYYCSSINDKESLWSLSARYAFGNGRFYFAFMQPLFNIIVPYAYGSYLFSRIANLILILVGVGLFSINIKSITGNRYLSYLFLLLFVVYVSIKGGNNPIISFPVYFSLSWAIFMGAIFFYWKYLILDVKKFKYFSLILYLACLLFYEVYLLCAFVFLFLEFVVKGSFKEYKHTLWNAMVRNYEYWIIVMLYCIVYFVFKKCYSISGYDGVNMTDSFSLLNTLQALFRLTQGAIPLFFYFFTYDLYEQNVYTEGGALYSTLNPFVHIQLVWLIKALLVGAISWMILSVIEVKVTLTKFQKIGLLSLVILMVFIPSVLPSLTIKYQYYTASGGMNNYITTYFSSFMVYAVLAVFILQVSRISSHKFKYVAMVFITLFLMYSSILMDYSNHHAAKDLNGIYNLFENVEELCQTDEFKKRIHGQGNIIIAPSLYSVNSNISYYNCCGFDMSNYFHSELNMPIQVKKDTLNVIFGESQPVSHLEYKVFDKGYYFILSSYAQKDSLTDVCAFIHTSEKELDLGLNGGALQKVVIDQQKSLTTVHFNDIFVVGHTSELRFK